MNKEKFIHQLSEDAHVIISLANMISLKYHENLNGYGLGMPILNQKSKKIKEFAEDIKKSLLGSLFKLTDDADTVNYELAEQQLKAFTWLSSVELEQLKKYNEKLALIPDSQVNTPTLIEV